MIAKEIIMSGVAGMQWKRGGVLRLEADGRIAIQQETVNGWPISWNPDDGRFYVHNLDEDQTTAGTFTLLRNARYWAKTHNVAERHQASLNWVTRQYKRSPIMRG